MRSFYCPDVPVDGSIQVRLLRVENATESATEKRRELLKVKVKALFEANNGEYGYRRVHQALLRGGEECSPELVRSSAKLGLEPCQPRPYRHSLTEQDGAASQVPDLVNRDFTAEKPGQKMVGDITYIPTWEGWAFLATVIDCATRKIAGGQWMTTTRPRSLRRRSGWPPAT